MRLGIIGYGNIGSKHHAAFKALGADVVAAANRTADGRRRAEAAGIPRSYASATELLQGEALDGVLVTPSFASNFEVALACIESGVATLVEKPPGLTVAQAETLRDRASSRGVPVLVGFNRLHYASVRAAIADAGGLAEVSGVTVEWSENPERLLERGFTGDAILRRNQSNSVHGLSMMTYLAGDVPCPSVHVIRREGPYDFVMTLSGVSDRGIPVTFLSNWDVPAPWRVRFTTSKGTYTFAPLERCEFVGADRRTRELDLGPEDIDFKPGFLAQARTFLEVLRGAPVPAHLSLDASVPVVALAHTLTERILAWPAGAS